MKKFCMFLIASFIVGCSSSQNPVTVEPIQKTEKVLMSTWVNDQDTLTLADSVFRYNSTLVGGLRVFGDTLKFDYERDLGEGVGIHKVIRYLYNLTDTLKLVHLSGSSLVKKEELY